jgi:hypothetical protein
MIKGKGFMDKRILFSSLLVCTVLYGCESSSDYVETQVEDTPTSTETAVTEGKGNQLYGEPNSVIKFDREGDGDFEYRHYFDENGLLYLETNLFEDGSEHGRIELVWDDENNRLNGNEFVHGSDEIYRIYQFNFLENELISIEWNDDGYYSSFKKYISDSGYQSRGENYTGDKVLDGYSTYRYENSRVIKSNRYRENDDPYSETNYSYDGDFIRPYKKETIRESSGQVSDLVEITYFENGKTKTNAWDYNTVDINPAHFSEYFDWGGMALYQEDHKSDGIPKTIYKYFYENQKLNLRTRKVDENDDNTYDMIEYSYYDSEENYLRTEIDQGVDGTIDEVKYPD